MSDYNNFNQRIITEFRENAGKVGGDFARTPLLLFTTIGSKSGQPRTLPLAYINDEDRIIIIASKGGAPTNPDWYHNLLAHPTVTVEIGSERFQAQAQVTQEPERSRLYARIVEHMPGFAEYLRNTSRKIPVVALERIDATN